MLIFLKRKITNKSSSENIRWFSNNWGTFSKMNEKHPQVSQEEEIPTYFFSLRTNIKILRIYTQNIMRKHWVTYIMEKHPKWVLKYPKLVPRRTNIPKQRNPPQNTSKIHQVFIYCENIFWWGDHRSKKNLNLEIFLLTNIAPIIPTNETNHDF